MVDHRAAILSEIDAFLRRHPMAETAFGKAAINDGKLISRLRRGDNVTVRTIERVSRFMAEWRPESDREAQTQAKASTTPRNEAA